MALKTLFIPLLHSKTWVFKYYQHLLISVDAVVCL